MRTLHIDTRHRRGVAGRLLRGASAAPDHACTFLIKTPHHELGSTWELKDRNRHCPARLLGLKNERSMRAPRAPFVMTLISATSQSCGGGWPATPASGCDLTDLSHDAQIRGHHGVWDAKMTRSGSSRHNSGRYAFLRGGYSGLSVCRQLAPCWHYQGLWPCMFSDVARAQHALTMIA
jgi:hypothetical protein